MDNRLQIVVVSSDLESRQRVVEMLHRQGLDPICSSTVDQCREILAQDNVVLAFCDRNLLDGDYRDVLTAATCASRKSKARIVLMSSVIDPEEYQAAKASGLFEVIASPCRPTDVEWMVILARRNGFARTARPRSSKTIQPSEEGLFE